MKRIVPVIACAAAVTVLASTAQAATVETQRSYPDDPVVVATHLNNPRQLSLLANGELLVAEAGRGGSMCSEEGCIGTTGAISKVAHPWSAHNQWPTKIAKGLPSSAGPDGGFAGGSAGVSNRGLGSVYIAMTYAPPDAVVGLPSSKYLGKLLRADKHGRFHIRADITKVELEQNPDGDIVESNPYAVLALPDREIVADAAGNTIIQKYHGKASVFAVLPNHHGRHAVPTSLALDPDGTVWVGDLNGENPDTARVWHLSATGEILGWVGGFTTITGVAVDQAGTLYVSELFAGGSETAPPGRVTMVPKHGSRWSTDVPFPAGIAVDDYNRVYVSAWSIADRDGIDLGGGEMSPPGQVWRLR